MNRARDNRVIRGRTDDHTLSVARHRWYRLVDGDCNLHRGPLADRKCHQRKKAEGRKMAMRE